MITSSNLKLNNLLNLLFGSCIIFVLFLCYIEEFISSCWSSGLLLHVPHPLIDWAPGMTQLLQLFIHLIFLPEWPQTYIIYIMYKHVYLLHYTSWKADGPTGHKTLWSMQFFMESISWLMWILQKLLIIWETIDRCNMILHVHIFDWTF